MKRLLLLVCLTFAYTSAASAAPSLRCNGRIMKVGAPAAYVLSQCGEPENQVVQESVARAGTTGRSRIVGLALSEHWVYDRGFGRFPAVLFFVDGRLKRIEFLPQRSETATRVY